MQNTSRSECMNTSRGGNDGQTYFQKTEGEGPGFLCGDSYSILHMAWRR